MQQYDIDEKQSGPKHQSIANAANSLRIPDGVSVPPDIKKGVSDGYWLLVWQRGRLKSAWVRTCIIRAIYM